MWLATPWRASSDRARRLMLPHECIRRAGGAVAMHCGRSARGKASNATNRSSLSKAWPTKALWLGRASARCASAAQRAPCERPPRSLRRNGVCNDTSCDPDGCGADRPARWEARMHGSQKTADSGGKRLGGKSTHAHARLRTTRGETAQNAPPSNAQGPHTMDTRARQARHARLPATRTLVQTTKNASQRRQSAARA